MLHQTNFDRSGLSQDIGQWQFLVLEIQNFWFHCQLLIKSGEDWIPCHCSLRWAHCLTPLWGVQCNGRITGTAKLKYSGQILSQPCSVNHKSHIHCLGIEPWPPQQKWVTNSLSHGMDTELVQSDIIIFCFNLVTIEEAWNTLFS